MILAAAKVSHNCCSIKNLAPIPAMSIYFYQLLLVYARTSISIGTTLNTAKCDTNRIELNPKLELICDFDEKYTTSKHVNKHASFHPTEILYQRQLTI